jgi:hypothetical protein
MKIRNRCNTLHSVAAIGAYIHSHRFRLNGSSDRDEALKIMPHLSLTPRMTIAPVDIDAEVITGKPEHFML